jgi:hypothetical protein
MARSFKPTEPAAQYRQEDKLLLELIEEHDAADDQFLLARRCLLSPIEAVFDAASLLSEAADAHLAGDG